MKTRLLKIKDLVLNDLLYPRESIDKETVKRYAEAMKEGAKFPPVVIGIYEKQQQVVDGWHRINAYKRNKVTHIEAEVIEFQTERDFYVEAVKRNVIHGRIFHEKEKSKIVLKLKQMDIDRVDISKIVFMPKGKIRNICSKNLQKNNVPRESDGPRENNLFRFNKENVHSNLKNDGFLESRFRKFLNDMKAINQKEQYDLSKKSLRILENIKIEINNLIGA